jgi:hypothetical protein
MARDKRKKILGRGGRHELGGQPEGSFSCFRSFVFSWFELGFAADASCLDRCRFQSRPVPVTRLACQINGNLDRADSIHLWI